MIRSQRWSERGIHQFWRKGYICGGFIPRPPQWETFALEPHSRKTLLGFLGENINPQLEGYAWDISIKCKVGALLNKVTTQTFESLSNQLIFYADLSMSDVTGSTLLLVIHAIVDKTKAGALFSDVYAKLCRKLMDEISPHVRVCPTNDSRQELVSGRDFFKDRLLRLCQTEFGRRWLDVNSGRQLAAPYSDELYDMAKTRRQRISATRFIGELFKAGVVAEGTVGRCITMLLWNTISPQVILDTSVPENEMIESVCALLSAAGKELDRGEMQEEMNGYFERIENLMKRNSICSRMRFMLQVSDF